MNKISQTTVEEICKLLAEERTGSQITTMLQGLNLHDPDQKLPNFGSHSTKWKRLYNGISNAMNSTQSTKPLLAAIEYITQPQYYVSNSTAWNRLILSLNELLIFNGLKVSEAGKIQTTATVQTISEAQQRLSSLREVLERTDIHPNVLKYCTKELLAKDYFHSVFEAVKGLLFRVKTISNLPMDGIALIEKAFSTKNPAILIQHNMIQSQDEKSEYFGLCNLLKAIVQLYRNPGAHKLRYFNPTNKSDAITALMTISLAHYQLDNCVNVRDFIK